MDELVIGEKTYISSKRAAKITGYAKDYVGQLCREGRVEARLVGRNWYVLESSIMEHRFGALEKEVEKQPQAAEVQKKEPISWVSPTYTTEEPITVPAITPKPAEVVESRRVVQDMQQAWQEWFTQQKSQTLALEESSEEFDGSLVPVIESSFEPEEYAAPVVEEVQVPIHTYAPKQEEQHESFTSAYSVMDLTPAPAQLSQVVPAHEAEERTATMGSSLPLRVLLLGVAFIAVCVALIGTGLAGDLIHTSDSTQQKVLKYLGGESEYDNSK